MARKLRLEFPGAIYHVINRGNYRAWIFEDERTQAAFEACLFEAAERSRWLVHAFAILGNHFHLAVETPEANLVAGMQWLQSTFANRFNRLRSERGHLFQGRYKALLVEEGEALGQVCHYIHLNPVRAGIVPVAELATYRYSSYWYLRRPKTRPACLTFAEALRSVGERADEPAGWSSYQDYLAWQAEAGPAGRNAAYVSLSRGWALGGADFKRALLQDHALAEITRAWGVAGAREMREGQWAAALATALRTIPAEARANERKSAPWKVAVATWLKETTDVANDWLARELAMGSGIYVSKHVGLQRHREDGEAAELLQRLRKVKGTA